VQEVEQLRLSAERWSSQELTLSDEGTGLRWSLTREQLRTSLRLVTEPPGGAASLSLHFDARRLGEELAKAQLDLSPRDARFEVASDGTVRVIPSQAGYALDMGELVAALEAAAASGTGKGPLPLRPGAPPALDTATAEALGIKGEVARFTTRHPCCQPRVGNIHRAADLVDGFVVRPGQRFSLNEVLGQRTLARGFVEAPTIEEGEMVDTVGGGVSQFTTTLFNAVLHGGYAILERQPHSYWFSRYPMGHEATLSWPHPDLVFENDSQAGLLIRATYTKTSITLTLYGDNGGRRVETSVSSRMDIVQPPVEFVADPTMPPDKEKRLDSGCIGWSVITSRKITFPDGRVKEESRKVTYQPKSRRLKVHPCRIPDGEPGHTDQPCPVPEEESPADASASEPTGSPQP